MEGRLSAMSESRIGIQDNVKESKGNQVKSLMEGNRTIVQVRQHEFSVGWPGSEIAPCPGEYLLGALAGCTSGVASLMAKQMNFDLRGMTIEVWGFGGNNKVTATAILNTPEKDERIQKLKEATESVCPVHKFFKSTGVEMDIEWKSA
jgi:putative redox protein